MTESSPVIRWKKDVVPHDFDAAEAFLSIRLNPKEAKELVKRLKNAPLTKRRANDILRASGREPLPLNDPGVLRDLVHVVAGERLSPVLVVSFDDGAEIADGYHRISLTYALDPFGVVPVRIASLSRPSNRWAAPTERRPRRDHAGGALKSLDSPEVPK